MDNMHIYRSYDEIWTLKDPHHREIFYVTPDGRDEVPHTRT